MPAGTAPRRRRPGQKAQGSRWGNAENASKKPSAPRVHGDDPAPGNARPPSISWRCVGWAGIDLPGQPLGQRPVERVGAEPVIGRIQRKFIVLALDQPPLPARLQKERKKICALPGMAVQHRLKLRPWQCLQRVKLGDAITWMPGPPVPWVEILSVCGSAIQADTQPQAGESGPRRVHGEFARNLTGVGKLNYLVRVSPRPCQA